MRIASFTFGVVVASAVLSGCGYHVAGRGEGLPKSIHVIAVPALENKTTSYRIEQRLTAATVHEFLAKTRYRVVSDPANGDAVLRGKVLGLEAVPLLFDTATGRATTMLVTVKCEVTFEDRETGKALYQLSVSQPIRDFDRCKKLLRRAGSGPGSPGAGFCGAAGGGGHGGLLARPKKPSSCPGMLRFSRATPE